jgi:NAD-dependent deacetylase
LFKVRCSKYHDDIRLWKKDLNLGDLSKNGHQLRPHIVWFGEDVPLIAKAAEIVSQCEVLIIVGTSMQVYPAAGLLNYAPLDTPVYFVDPNPAIASGSRVKVIASSATQGIPTVVDLLS